MKNINTKKGFTIIEVVLVLAIAGLIFLMVFVALPNLQRSQRDTQRRNDYSQLAANIQSYMSSNGGRLPREDTVLDVSKYINSTGQDPNGNTYFLSVVEMTDGRVVEEFGDQIGVNVFYGPMTMESADACAAFAEANEGQCDGAVWTKTETLQDGSAVSIYIHADCSDNSADGNQKPAYVEGSSRKYAIYADLETGTYCQAY